MIEIWRLVPPEYRRGCVGMVALVPVKAILNVVGVAALVPVMMLVLNPDKLHDIFIWDWANSLGLSEGNVFTISIIIGVIAVLVVKIALSLLIINFQNTFLLKMYRNISSRLFMSLYSRGLVFIKNSNSARMAFNVTGVCYSFVFGTIGGLIHLLGELTFVFLLFASLMIYSLEASLMVICTFLPVLGVYLLFVRRPLYEMGRKENELRREQSRLIYEAFKGYSEVQVNDAFSLIQRRFSRGLEDIAGYRVKSGLIQSLPSFFMELSIVVTVAIMLLFNVNAMDPKTIVFISVFAVSILKLMPSVQGIIGDLTSLSATRYTKEIISDIQHPGSYPTLHADNVEPMTFKKEISAQGLTFSFDGDVEPVINNLDFTIPKGCRFGIKGRTGVGKTTLFNLLLGLYAPDSGQICIDGVPITMDNLPSWHKLVGYVPQDVFVSDSTILENVALGFEPSSIDRDKATEALRRASLYDFVESLPKGIDTPTGEAGCRMSGGQKQRLGIARALYKEASVLFFDEATSSLDARTEKEINDAIRELSENNRDLTIIVISHRDSTMELCDVIFNM